MLNRFIGLPPNASEHGYMIDHMLEFAHWFMLLLFVGWSTFFIFTIIRFHKSRHPRADYHGVKTKASTHIEFMVVLVDVLLLVGFALPLWGNRVSEFPKKDPVRIRVVGQQFIWNFHYPGADGQFGKSDAAFVNGSNDLGLDPKDPAGKDDVISKNELHLPFNRDVILEITSKDVIHSLSLQSMRIGQDAVPGLTIPIWFKPVRTGSYEVICGQLCGLGHYNMRASMLVESQDEYEAFLKEAAQLSGGGTSAAPAPSTSGGAPANPPPPTGTSQEPAMKVPSVPVPSEQPPGATLQAEPAPGGAPASAATPNGPHK
ncbi:MAG: cytochrome c oxidase subunit [Chthoniobacter sp.]|jgi:cytochrome c oxidase subunit 2|nr:cytochrome c oxidase subunit [Chthoniobacter sp.]